MSADIIQFVPRPNPNREKQLEAQMLEIMGAVFSGEPVAIGMEPVIYVEMPQDDPAA